MNEIKALRDRLNKVVFICELSEQDQNALEHLARFWATINGFEFNPDFMNEKAWCAVDLIDRITEV